MKIFPPFSRPLRRAAIVALLAAATVCPAEENGMHRLLPGASVLKDIGQAKDRVDFIGQTTYSEEQLIAPLMGELRDLNENGVTPARADDLAFYVATFYRKAGFSQVAVDYEIRGGKVIIRIKEGPRSLLQKVTFAGNATISSATLYEYMIGATPEQLLKKPDQFPYTSAEIDAGADRVRGLYLSMGFLKATVEAGEARLLQGGTRAEVTVRIVEGPRYNSGEVTFTGLTIFPGEELVAALGVPVDGPFAPGTETVMARNLQSFYKTRGYYQAEVTATANPENASGGRVPIVLHVLAKQLFRFGWSTVKNETQNPRLREDFLPKRFAHLHGEVYNPEKLDETFREMLRSGLFENLRMTLTPVNGDELQLDLTATEAKAKEVGFTIGAGSYEGVSLGIRLGDRNIFGSGRPLTFAVDYSQRGFRGELLYVDPWFFDTRFALRSRLYSEAREEQGYSKNSFGLRVDLTRKAVRHLELGAFIEGMLTNITDHTIDPALLGPLDYQLTTIGLTQTTDFRNDPINPARGFVFTTTVELSAIESEAAFTRSTARFSYYLPVGRQLLAFGARVGYISPLIDDLPIDVRFFNGGANTVRSFSERELGPKDSGLNPIGGYMYTVFNVEYTFPVTGGLQGAVFFDAGNLKNSEAHDSGVKVLGSEDMRYAVGVGLRYALPIGPLRLDYGINPDPRVGEDFGAFHFSFGFAF